MVNTFSYDIKFLRSCGKNWQKIILSCAESCTGGLFAQTMTDIPGISAVSDRGLVTYSNQAKMQELEWNLRLLKSMVVSKETAIEMAEGLKQVTRSRLCISVTGIAGPGGGSEDKPVGLVYICAILDDRKVVKEFRMRNVSRKWNRNYTVLCMLDMINKLIEKAPDSQFM